MNKINYAENQYEALDGVVALIIAEGWSEFRTPDFERMDKDITYKIISYGQILFEVNKMSELRYHYESIGRS